MPARPGNPTGSWSFSARPSIELAHELQLIRDPPVLDDAAIADVLNVDLIDLHAAAGRRQAEEIATVSSGHHDSNDHRVLGRNHILDLVVQIGERATNGENDGLEAV